MFNYIFTYNVKSLSILQGINTFIINIIVFPHKNNQSHNLMDIYFEPKYEPFVLKHILSSPLVEMSGTLQVGPCSSSGKVGCRRLVGDKFSNQVMVVLTPHQLCLRAWSQKFSPNSMECFLSSTRRDSPVGSRNSPIKFYFYAKTTKSCNNAETFEPMQQIKTFSVFFLELTPFRLCGSFQENHPDLINHNCICTAANGKASCSADQEVTVSQSG